MTLREKILATELYHSGDTFRVMDMAKSVGETNKRVAAALNAMKVQGVMSYDGRFYSQSRKHPIHQRRLNDPTPINLSRA